MKKDQIHLRFVTEGGDLSLVENEGEYFVKMDESMLLEYLSDEDAAGIEPIQISPPFEELSQAWAALWRDYPYALELRVKEISQEMYWCWSRSLSAADLKTVMDSLLRRELEPCVHDLSKNPYYGHYKVHPQKNPQIFEFPAYEWSASGEKLSVLMSYLAGTVKPLDFVACEEGRAILAQDLIHEQDQETIAQLVLLLERSDRFCFGAWVGAMEDGTLLKLAQRYVELNRKEKGQELK